MKVGVTSFSDSFRQKSGSRDVNASKKQRYFIESELSLEAVVENLINLQPDSDGRDLDKNASNLSGIKLL